MIEKEVQHDLSYIAGANPSFGFWNLNEFDFLYVKNLLLNIFFHCFRELLEVTSLCKINT